ncbi:MAG: LysR substrate-binding domain-containing protein [Alphaproteobacteria bacterium]
MITLRQLRYFHALGDVLHFGRAAEACHVTQPALSMQIKELESQLGVTLIERRKNGIQLTSEGREIARRAADILLSARDLQNFASDKGGPLGRTLALGVIPTIAPYFLPLALPELQQRYSELDLMLHEAQTDHLLDKLSEGALDVALLALPAGDSSFKYLTLFADRFLLAMPDSAPEPDSIRVSDLRAEKLILLEEGHCLRDQALAVCGAVGSGAMSKFGATSLTTVLQMVANGYGSTLLPEMAVPVEVRAGTPLTLRHLVPEPSRTIGLLWRASAPRQERFEHLGQVFLDVWRSSNPGYRER